jgi:hypothetical protein
VHTWLGAVADALAREAGVPRRQLELDDGAVTTLLDVARVAAHESGDRRNAPLVCYLLGLSAGAAKDLDTLADTVRRSSS